MRSRPDVSVLLDPFAPKPGDRLRAVVRLQSHSVTPYDAIDVTLIGRESRYKNTTSTGKTTTTHDHRREICRLGARFEAGVLQPGLWEREVNIDIPLGTPPAYKSPLSRIQYDLAVRVHIPWWPDRHAHYDLGVVATPYQGGTSEAQSFTSQAGEYRGEEPVIEMSLDDTVLEEDVRLDNQIQIGHNAHIGAHTAMAGCSAVAGSARIGRYCLIGGGAGVLGHLELCDRVIVTAMSLVTHSIREPGEYSSGTPLMDNRSWRKSAARFKQLDSIARRLPGRDD